MSSDDQVSDNDAVDSPSWDRAKIMRRLETVLDPAEFEQLQRGEPEAAWLERLVTAAETLALPAVPSDVSIRLRTIFPVPPPARRAEAILTNDSRIERELVGVRGSGDSAGWTLTYETDLGDLLVDVWSDGATHDIEAQLMSTGRQAEFSLSLTGPAEFEQRSDRLGRATIEGVPAGIYVLMVKRPDVEITARLEVPTS